MKPKGKIDILLDQKGNKVAVVMRIKDFEKLIQEREDLEDLAAAYEITSKKFKRISYEKIGEELFGHRNY